jgi:hypothetical protein
LFSGAKQPLPVETVQPVETLAVTTRQPVAVDS